MTARFVLRWSLLLAAIAGGCTASAADEALPQPVIVVSDVVTVPANHGWLTEAGRAALADAIAKKASGELDVFVFAAADGVDAWTYRFIADEAATLVSIEGLARNALETCEFFSTNPCFIVSINGFDARDASGGLPVQPTMLANQPATFDANRVPFLSSRDRQAVRSYSAETRAKVLVVTVQGGWLWRAGDDLFAATATASADCTTTYPNQICLLYAVNDRVVFKPGAPR